MSSSQSDEDPLSEQYKYVKMLDSEVKLSLRRYTQEYYTNINKYLRGHIKRLDKEHQQIIDDIQDAFSDCTPLSDSIILYRGSTRSELNPNSYLSTSLDWETAMRFKRDDCCVYVITVSAGCKVLPLIDVSEHSHESEILLNIGEIFTVTHREMKHGVMFISVTMTPPSSIVIVPDPIVPKNIQDERIVEIISDALQELLDSEFIEEITEEDIEQEVKNIYDRFYGYLPTGKDIKRIVQKYRDST